MGRYWHCVLTADHLMCLYSTVAIVRSQATTGPSPHLFSHDHLVIQATGALGSFSLCHCLYYARQQERGAAEITETHWTSVWTIEVSRLDSREGQAILLFSKLPRPVLGPTHFPTYRVPGAFPQG